MNEKKIRVAINGFGRIGRFFFKLALKNPKVEIVAINDLGDIENMVYLLKHDSAQMEFNLQAKAGDGFIEVENKKIPFYAMRNPEELPWKELEVDVVAECTGVFNSFEKSNAHLVAGAKKVVLSGPTKDSQNSKFATDKIGSTVLMGVNEELTKTCQITSNGSCTTNAVTLPLKILEEEIGVESAMMTTIHSYTASQSLVDGPVKPGKDVRRGRAAAQNIIPTTTGSNKAVPKVYNQLDGKFSATAIRVPTISGSLVDLTVVLKKETTVEEINEIFKKAEKEYVGILKTTTEPLVSSDIKGEVYAGIIDLNFTRSLGKMAKIYIWYDNEAGYSQMLLNHVIKMGIN